MMSFKNCIRIRIASFCHPAYYFWRLWRCHVSVSRPCLKVVLVEVGWRRRPNILAPETRKMVLAPLLCFFWLVWWCIVLLKGEQFSLKCFWLVESQESKLFQCTNLCSLLHLLAERWRMISIFWKEESFCRLNIFLVELRIFSENFARTLEFCRLKVASTINNFSSEKVTEVCEFLVSLYFQRWQL